MPPKPTTTPTPYVHTTARPRKSQKNHHSKTNHDSKNKEAVGGPNQLREDVSLASEGKSSDKNIWKYLLIKRKNTKDPSSCLKQELWQKLNLIWAGASSKWMQEVMILDYGINYGFFSFPKLSSTLSLINYLIKFFVSSSLHCFALFPCLWWLAVLTQTPAKSAVEKARNTQTPAIPPTHKSWISHNSSNSNVRHLGNYLAVLVILVKVFTV